MEQLWRVAAPIGGTWPYERRESLQEWLCFGNFKFDIHFRKHVWQALLPFSISALRVAHLFGAKLAQAALKKRAPCEKVLPKPRRTAQQRERSECPVH